MRAAMMRAAIATGDGRPRRRNRGTARGGFQAHSETGGAPGDFRRGFLRIRGIGSPMENRHFHFQKKNSVPRTAAQSSKAAWAGLRLNSFIQLSLRRPLRSLLAHVVALPPAW